MGIKRLENLMTSDYNHSILKKNKSLSDQSLEGAKTKRNRSRYSGKAARTRADYIAQKLDNPSSKMFYLKCAWNLTDAYLDRLLYISLTKKDPIRYFSAAAVREMRENL